MRTPSPRVLLLAYYFPPATGIASERMAGFHHHLPEVGWDPLVVAPRKPHFFQDPAGAPGDPPSVVRTGSLELSRLFRHGMGVTEGAPLEPVEAGSSASAARRLVRECLYVPDAQVGWIPFALRAGARVLEEVGTGDCVLFSSSVPYSAHLAAARLARRFQIPWVAEFRDPWTAQDPSRLPSSVFRRKLDARMEEWILRRAHHVVVTAGQTRNLLLAHFPRTPSEKVSVIPNGFEPPGREDAGQTTRTGSVPGPGQALILVHAGTVQDPAYLMPLLRAVAGLERDRPGSVQVISLGDRRPWHLALQHLELGDPDWVHLRGVVSSQVAVQAMFSASALLLFYPHPRFSRVISGKLFSYLGARRPILGVVPPGSEMEELIRRAGDGRLVPRWEEEEIRGQLDVLLAEHEAGELQGPRVPEDRVASFTRKARTEALARVLAAVLEKGGRG